MVTIIKKIEKNDEQDIEKVISKSQFWVQQSLNSNAVSDKAANKLLSEARIALKNAQNIYNKNGNQTTGELLNILDGAAIKLSLIRTNKEINVPSENARYDYDMQIKNVEELLQNGIEYCGGCPTRR